MRPEAADTLIGTVVLDALAGTATLEDGPLRRRIAMPDDSPTPSAVGELLRRGVRSGDTIQIRAIRKDGPPEPLAVMLAFEGVVT